MGKILRRLRGIIGTGITWAIGWVGVNAVLGLVAGVPLHFMGPLALSAIVQGFVAGGAFAVVLSIAERRHSLEELSLRRVALWGAIGGMLIVLPALPILASYGVPLGRMLLPMVIDGLVGAGFASGSVVLARRADTNLIEEGDGQRLLD